jgi:hypothetical protein
VLPRALVMGVHVVYLHHHCMAARSSARRRCTPELGIGIRQNDHAIAESESSAVPTRTPYLGEAKGPAEPIDGSFHVGVHQFRNDTGRPGRAIDDHDGPFEDGGSDAR